MIPKSFKLVNRTYKVKEMSQQRSQDLKFLGYSDRDKAEVLVSRDNPDNAEATFFHELAHCLLWVSTKPKLSNNEEFVESLGAALNQYMQTKKGEFSV